MYGVCNFRIFKGEIKDTLMEKAPSNKAPALTKMAANMGIWVFGTSNQLSVRGS